MDNQAAVLGETERLEGGEFLGLRLLGDVPEAQTRRLRQWGQHWCVGGDWDYTRGVGADC